MKSILIPLNYSINIKTDSGTTIVEEYEDFVQKNDDTCTTDILLEHYKKYLDNIIHSYKIIDVKIQEIDDIYLAFLLCQCIYCKKTYAYSANNFLNGILAHRCSCFFTKKREWNLIKDLGIYKDFEDFRENTDYISKYYMINPSLPISKENLIYGTTKDLKEYYSKNSQVLEDIFSMPIKKGEQQCNNCGFIFNKKDLTCPNCNSAQYRKR